MNKFRTCRGLILLYGFFSLLNHFNNWFLRKYRPVPLDAQEFAALTRGQNWAGGLIYFSLTLLFVLALYYMYNILKNVERKQAFSSDTLSQLNSMARTYLVMTIWTPISDMLLTLIFTSCNPVGQRIIRIGFGPNDMNNVLITACLYLLIEVIQEGYKTWQENKMVI